MIWIVEAYYDDAHFVLGVYDNEEAALSHKKQVESRYDLTLVNYFEVRHDYK
jgi:hypothetical protein